MLVRNPFYKKIEPAHSGEPMASYGGIALKCLWFWILFAAGIAAYLFVAIDSMPPLVLAAGLGVVLICPILTYWFPSTSLVAGSLFSLVLGYLLSMACKVYAAEYAGIIYLAIGITVLVFFTCLILYRTGVIKVNRKFRGTLLVLFLASIVGSGLVYISSFYTTAITDIFWGNGTIAIIVCVVSLLIATLNLIFEFDFATRIVEEGVRKKYEWIAAYGLFMTVIIIFVRVLELLSKFMSKKDG